MAWYAVETRPQSERKAAQELRRAGLRVYIPKQFRQVFKKEKRSVRSKPLMRGYVLVRPPANTADGRVRQIVFAAARLSGSVRDVLWYLNRSGDKIPIAIADKVVRSFIHRQRGGVFGSPAIETEAAKRRRLGTIFDHGDRVRVRQGPFLGHQATVDLVTNSLAVEALIQIFGRETRIVFSEPEEELVPIATLDEAA